jgi:hypothetical protein
MPTRKVADLLFQREFLALQTANLLCHVLDLTRKLHFELLDVVCSWVQASRTQAVVILRTVYVEARRFLHCVDEADALSSDLRREFCGSDSVWIMAASNNSYRLQRCASSVLGHAADGPEGGTPFPGLRDVRPATHERRVSQT